MAGRPTKYNEDRAKAITTALTAGNTRKASAAYAGVTDTTLQNWLKGNLAFLAAVQKAEAEAEVRHVANIAKASADGNWTASAWWLERRRHDEWGRKDRVTIDLRVLVDQIAAAEGLTDDEQAAVLAEAERLLRLSSARA
jgi:hypothetical protein